MKENRQLDCGGARIPLVDERAATSTTYYIEIDEEELIITKQ